MRLSCGPTCTQHLTSISGLWNTFQGYVDILTLILHTRGSPGFKTSTFLVRLFGRHAAPSVPRRPKPEDNQLQCPLTRDAQLLQQDINTHLVTHHYLTAVLWHVAGNGRPASGNPILVQPGLERGHAKLPDRVGDLTLLGAKRKR